MANCRSWTDSRSSTLFHVNKYLSHLVSFLSLLRSKGTDGFWLCTARTVMLLKALLEVIYCPINSGFSVK